eukprot:gene10146-2565_t
MIICQDGRLKLLIDPNKISEMRQWTRPTSLTKFQVLIGLIQYIGNSLPYLAENLLLFHDAAKFRKFKWNHNMECSCYQHSNMFTMSNSKYEKSLSRILKRLKSLFFFTFKDPNELFPNSLWHLDIMSMATSYSGYQYVLNILDDFTRFYILIPLKNKDTLEVTTSLFWIMALEGDSTCLKSNNGGEFINIIVDSKIEHKKLKGNLKFWPNIHTLIMIDLNNSTSSEFNSTPFNIRRNFNFYNQNKEVKLVDELSKSELKEQYKLILARNKLIYKPSNTIEIEDAENYTCFNKTDYVFTNKINKINMIQMMKKTFKNEPIKNQDSKHEEETLLDQNQNSNDEKDPKEKSQ